MKNIWILLLCITSQLSAMESSNNEQWLKCSIICISDNPPIAETSDHRYIAVCNANVVHLIDTGIWKTHQEYFDYDDGIASITFLGNFGYQITTQRSTSAIQHLRKNTIKTMMPNIDQNLPQKLGNPNKINEETILRLPNGILVTKITTEQNCIEGNSCIITIYKDTTQKPQKLSKKIKLSSNTHLPQLLKKKLTKAPAPLTPQRKVSSDSLLTLNSQKAEQE